MRISDWSSDVCSSDLEGPHWRHGRDQGALVGRSQRDVELHDGKGGAVSKLTTKARNKLPKKDFAGLDRSYPVNNRAHAANAKARATPMVEKGKLSPSAKANTAAKANKETGRHAG